jgi:hypothetical protein
MEWEYALKRTIIPKLKDRKSPFNIIWGHVRGMEYWTDVRDWLGGWPMEFSSVTETVDFVGKEAGLSLVNIATGEACSEFLFCDLTQNEQWREIDEAREQIPLARPFTHDMNHGHKCEVPSLAPMADSPATPQRSPLMLYEDGKPLWLRHSLHDHIRDVGCGRFCHWGDRLYFSSSDNSDPNSNGRTYSYCIDY